MEMDDLNTKELIEIQTRNGEVKQALVIFRFRKEDDGQCYIVYKYKEDYFAAKYNDVVGMSEMDTDLNSEEIEMLEVMLNDLGGDK